MTLRELLEKLEEVSNKSADVVCAVGPHEYEIQDVDYDEDEELLEITIVPTISGRTGSDDGDDD